MNQRAVAYEALGAAWDQVFALMLAGRISIKEAERIKVEVDRAGDAIVPDPMEALAVEFRSKMFSPTTLPQSDAGTGAKNQVPAMQLPQTLWRSRRWTSGLCDRLRRILPAILASGLMGLSMKEGVSK